MATKGKVAPVVEAQGFDLFTIAEAEMQESPASKATKGRVQTRNAFKQPYLRDGVVPVPFRVSLCLSIAEELMRQQGVDFVPLAIVLAVAKELHMDLSMQGRKPGSQVKAQAKVMGLGLFAEQVVRKGDKEAKLQGLKVNPAKLDALKACRYSVLAEVSA